MGTPRGCGRWVARCPSCLTRSPGCGLRRGGDRLACSPGTPAPGWERGVSFGVTAQAGCGAGAVVTAGSPPRCPAGRRWKSDRRGRSGDGAWRAGTRHRGLAPRTGRKLRAERRRGSRRRRTCVREDWPGAGSGAIRHLRVRPGCGDRGDFCMGIQAGARPRSSGGLPVPWYGAGRRRGHSRQTRRAL